MALSKIKFISIITCALLVVSGVAYGAFVVSNRDTIQASDSINSSDVENTKHKVEFKSGDTVKKTMYVDSDYNLSLKDAPYVFKDGSVYEWKSGSINLATLEKDDSSNNFVTGDMTFVSSVSSSSGSLSSTYNEGKLSKNNTSSTSVAFDAANNTVYLGGNNATDAYYSGLTVNANVQIISFKDGGWFGSDENIYEEKVRYDDNMTASDYSQIGAHYVNDDFNGLDDSNSNDTKSYNADFTIALANTEDKLTDYKPFKGGLTIGVDGNSNTPYGNEYTKAATNYLVRKFVLTRDVVFSGMTFNLGAYNGFYGASCNWAQNNYNNFIVGAYNEIDLNGHDLILANNTNLNAYGSITDSSSDRYGKIVVENGSTLQGLLTLEDCSHETDVVIYYHNLSLFRMYRMPYLDCSIDFKYGSWFKGFFLKDSGGRTGHGVSATINFLGPNSSLFNQTEENGVITRTVYYNHNILNQDTSSNHFIRNNLYHQRIKYDVKDSSVSFNYILPSVQGCTLDTRDTQLFIPSFFEFYLKNSQFNLNNELVFLPGSYLNVDRNSTVTFSNFEYTSSANGAYKYRAGGLIFASRLWSIAMGSTSKLNNGDGVAPQIFQSNDNFWNYVGNNMPAKCDFYGTIEFNDYSSYSSNKPGYVLSGIINFYEIDKIDSILATKGFTSNQVAIYPTQQRCEIGYTTLTNPRFTKDGKGNFVVMSYFNAPLISNDCVVDLNGNKQALRGTYDSKTGLVTVINNGTKSYYAYIHNNAFINSWYQDQLMTGEYKLVSNYDEANHYITVDGVNYVYYQGNFIQVSLVSKNGNAITATGAKLDCMIGGSSQKSAGAKDLTVKKDCTNSTLTYSSNRWVISTVS